MIFGRLRHRLLSRPRLWVFLLLWPVFALAIILAPLGIYSSKNTAVDAVLSLVTVLAVACLVVFALIARRFYRGIRELRNRLFEGDYETALDVAQHNPAVGIALGFEKALRRMLEFDARRGDKVAAGARLLSSLLQEAGVAFFIADLEEDLVHFSRAARQLFGVNADRFSLLSLLLLPANRDYASLHNAVARGERARAEAALTFHLPVRQAAREVNIRMLAVQSEEGLVLFVLGFLTLQAKAPAAPAATPQPERNDDATAQS